MSNLKTIIMVHVISNDYLNDLLGDIVLWLNNTDHYGKIKSMEIEHKQVTKAHQGDIVAVKLKKLVKTNDQVFKIVKK